nr:immunoglobulin heavy chain junction region [Mus musculus]
CASAHNFDVW